MTNDHDRPRTQFLRDEFAKAERQDAEFFAAQRHINFRRMRSETRRALTPYIVRAAAFAIALGLAITRGWI